MLSERVCQWLEDISESIGLIEEFTTGMTRAQFEVDPKTRYAVLYALLVISEASRRLPEDIKGRHSHIPWRDVADAGNIYRHQYHDLSNLMIWKTVSGSLKALKQSVNAEL